ncbi:MAG: leucine-rich repeat protein [Prevotella sp.]|nr:leucine-rich repeat protein [Prevotella sp.]
MRTKKLLLLATMLLSGVCATFAQSENEHPLAFILGVYDAHGEDYYDNWAVENWSATIKKDDSDPSKVWIYDFTPAGFPDAIYGIVNEERTEIRIPVNQTIGSNSSYDVVLEAYTNNGDEDITDFIVGTISEDGTITITPTTWIAAAAYNKGTTTLAGYYAVDRAVVFKKATVLNAKNFPDANFRSALASRFGIGEEAIITDEMISSITSLDVSNMSISDLTGIEHFTTLGELNCWGNQLTSVDVSKNTALIWLNCGNNQLTSLNVSQNTLLEYLSCRDNQLNSLDISENTALTKLYCQTNRLTSLDVSNNTALKEMWCNNNQLTSLDVSQNTALATLYCYSNQLTSLNISQNTALTIFNCHTNLLTSLDLSRNTMLESLGCSSNQLTSLDVSKNTKLTWLNCSNNKLTSFNVSHNTELTYFACASNQLTSLDVSGCTALENLYCYSNLINSLNVSQNTALTGLWCYRNLLTSLDVTQNTSLTELGCFSNQIKGEAMVALVASLPKVENGAFYVIDTQDESEGNEYTMSQVVVAKGKGWTLYDYNGGSDEEISLTKKTTVDGLEWTYTIVSEDGKTCVVGGEKIRTDEYGSIWTESLLAIDVNTTGAITVPTTLDGYTVIGTARGAFRNSKISSITLPNSLKSIGESAFYGSAIGSIVIPEGVTRIEDETFESCRNLASITLPKRLTYIAEEAFKYCPITSINLGESLVFIGDDAFWGTKLTSVTLPKSLLVIEGDAFVDCPLTSVISKIEEPFAISDYAFSNDRKEDSEYNSFQTATLYVPYGTKAKYEVTAGWKNFQNIVEMDLIPVDEDNNVDFGNGMDESDNLDGAVIRDIYYNIGDGKGEYNADEGCVVIKKTTDDGTVGELEGKDIFGEDFKGQFTGIVFKVPAGKGTIKVNAETTGNMLLKVKIGDNEPVGMELNGKLKVTFPYNVSETTYVYIYAGANNEAKGFGSSASGDAALKIYGIEFIRDNTPTDINSVDSGELTVDSWYTIDGKKLSGEPTKKGIYIYNGKKVVK